MEDCLEDIGRYGSVFVRVLYLGMRDGFRLLVLTAPCTLEGMKGLGSDYYGGRLAQPERKFMF